MTQRRIESAALRFLIEKRFGESAIAVPFPQRDVYIRSIPPGITNADGAKDAA